MYVKDLSPELKKLVKNRRKGLSSYLSKDAAGNLMISEAGLSKLTQPNQPQSDLVSLINSLRQEIVEIKDRLPSRVEDTTNGETVAERLSAMKVGFSDSEGQALRTDIMNTYREKYGEYPKVRYVRMGDGTLKEAFVYQEKDWGMIDELVKKHYNARLNNIFQGVADKEKLEVRFYNKVADGGVRCYLAQRIEGKEKYVGRIRQTKPIQQLCDKNVVKQVEFGKLKSMIMVEE